MVPATSATLGSSMPSAAAACSTSCAAPVAPTSWRRSTASVTPAQTGGEEGRDARGADRPLARGAGRHRLAGAQAAPNVSTSSTKHHHRPLRTLTDREREQLVYETVGPNGPLAKRKAFTRADVIRVVAPALYGCMADELDRVVAGIVQHRECVRLVGQPDAPW